ncbi:MAG: hypothetical protein WBD01_11230 [Salaquimonas sp.]
MIVASFGLYILVSIILLAFAAKFILGPAPADYHQKIIEASGAVIEEGHRKVFRAVYQVMGGSFIALAISIIGLAIFGVLNGVVWAKFLIFCVGLFASVSAMIVTRAMEDRTGVKTPWKAAAMLTVILALAFILSVA